jgi:PAS domain S-box-containing protein
VELSQEGLFIHEEGILHDLNPAAARMVGFAPRELIGRHVFTLVAPESLSFAKAQMDIKPTEPYELLLQRRDGTKFWAELQGRSLSWHAKTLRVVTARDITARKRAEAALHDSEALFRQLAENIKEVFFVRDLRENRMIYVSPSYEEIWQRPRQRLMEDPLDFVQSIHPEDRRVVLDTLQRQTPENPFRREYRIVRKDGDVRWIRVNTFPIMNAAGQVHRIAGIAADITDFKQAELERLQHEKAQLDTLVREIHHRIKNNLQGIIGLLQYEMGRHPSLSEVMQGSISKIRSVAVIYGLQSQTPGRDLLLCEVVPAVVGAASDSREPRPKIVLNADLPRSLKLAEPDAVPLALIINELITNAVKHGPVAAHGVIEVHVEQRGPGGFVRVRTSGARLPDGFDFEAGTGLGTGLHLVKALLPRQGATLTISQEGETVVLAELALLPPVVEPLPHA